MQPGVHVVPMRLVEFAYITPRHMYAHVSPGISQPSEWLLFHGSVRETCILRIVGESEYASLKKYISSLSIDMHYSLRTFA
jgi:hypothetical protein